MFFLEKIPETEIKEQFLNFTNAQKHLVSKYSEELLKYEFFEVTALKKILSQINTSKDSEILHWSKKVEESILNLNNDLFQKLCTLD